MYCKTINYLRRFILWFGEIGEFQKLVQISRPQIKTSLSLDIPVLEIAKLLYIVILC